MKYLSGLTMLIIAFALGLVLTSADKTVYAQDKEYVGANQCKLCHSTPAKGDQYNKWKEMKHAHALEALSSEQALEIAKEKNLANPPSEEPLCLKCHVTGYDEATKAAPAKIDMKMSVQCESCHGPASEHLKDGKVAMMKKDAEVDFSANITRPTVENCTKCHNNEGPTWNPEKYTLADGTKVGFDFEQASAIIAHLNPQNAESK